MKYLHLLRITHWVKNLYVFAPLFFSGMVFDSSGVIAACWAFFSFSFAASAIYIVNDLKDRSADALHPIKKLRPLASGSVQPVVAVVISVIVFALAIVTGFQSSPFVVGIVIAYLIMNLLYTYWLKKISIVDINIISIGFVLRVLAGGFAISEHVSHWLIIMVYLLSLFLAIAKRRDDLILVNNTGTSSDIRKSLDGYNLDFVNISIAVLSALIVVCYIMYVTSAEVIERLNFEYAYFTLVFVVTGIFRYMQLVFIDNQSGSPTDVLIKDRFIQLAVILWILSFAFILYAIPWLEK